MLDCHIVGGYLCLQYSATPVPAELVDDHHLHEGTTAGLAFDESRHLVYDTCRSAYRTARSGECVVGALKIGPGQWPQFGRIRVLFAPFAYTPGIGQNLRALRIAVDAEGVRHVTVEHA